VRLLADQQEDGKQNTAGHVLIQDIFLCWALHFYKICNICLQIPPSGKKKEHVGCKTQSVGAVLRENLPLKKVLDLTSQKLVWSRSAFETWPVSGHS